MAIRTFPSVALGNKHIEFQFSRLSLVDDEKHHNSPRGIGLLPNDFILLLVFPHIELQSYLPENFDSSSDFRNGNDYLISIFVQCDENASYLSIVDKLVDKFYRQRLGKSTKIFTHRERHSCAHYLKIIALGRPVKRCHLRTAANCSYLIQQSLDCSVIADVFARCRVKVKFQFFAHACTSQTISKLALFCREKASAVHRYVFFGIRVVQG